MNRVITSVLIAILFVIPFARITTAEERILPKIKSPKSPVSAEEYKDFDPLRDLYFGDFKLSSHFHSRISSNSSNNLADLDNDKDDSIYYVGYQYDFSLSLKHMSSAEFFLHFKRINISEYDAPLWLDDDLTTLFGNKHEYSQGEILPRVYRAYLDLPVTDFLDTRVQIGALTYGVGNEQALGGKYPNLGVTLSAGPKNFRGRLHYDRVDSYNKLDCWGPVISDVEEGAFHGRNTNANFFAADIMAKAGRHSIQPYVGVVYDYTHSRDRDNAFDDKGIIKNGRTIDKDLLGTVGVDLNLNFERFNLGVEFARNFGKARSDTSSDLADVSKEIVPLNDMKSGWMDDITHKGWLLMADAGYNLGIVRPKAKVVWASGPEGRRKDVLNGWSSSNNNRTFSVYSPTNTDIFDSHYQKSGIGPYLATASTYLFNFGIDRPGIFNDPFVIENVRFFNAGIEIFPVDKMYMSIDYWKMHADEAGYGINTSTGATFPEKLPSELGDEIDIFASYNITKHISVNMQGALFFPGEYYRVKTRADLKTRGDLGQSPVLPRDKSGDPSDAFFLALGLEFSF